MALELAPQWTPGLNLNKLSSEGRSCFADEKLPQETQLLEVSRSTHDFHNFLGLKRAQRMENREWCEIVNWETLKILSKYESRLDSTRRCSELCSHERLERRIGL